MNGTNQQEAEATMNYPGGYGHQLDTRRELMLPAHIALVLLERHGLVGGHSVREDSQGRAVLDVMPAEATVARAFDIAECFVRTAEAKGYLRVLDDSELMDIASKLGELQGYSESSRYAIGITARTSQNKRAR